MAWERSFEARVLKIRTKELKYQKLNYTIEVRRLIIIIIDQAADKTLFLFQDIMECDMVKFRQVANAGRANEISGMVPLFWSHWSHFGIFRLYVNKF